MMSKPGKVRMHRPEDLPARLRPIEDGEFSEVVETPALTDQRETLALQKKCD